jgi:hypothetical protein
MPAGKSRSRDAPRRQGPLPRAVLAAALVLLAAPRPAPAQTEIELRASSTDYHFAEISHSFDSDLLLDSLYIDVPDARELFLGVGYEFDLGRKVSLIPILYTVSAQEIDDQGDLLRDRGLMFGTLLHVDGRKWRAEGFAGHFFPGEGVLPPYTFVDSLDLTHVFGRCEVGLSTAAYRTEGEVFWVSGPLFKWNDHLGAWAASERFGDEREFRIVRTIDF